MLMLVRKRVVVCGGCVDGVGEEKGGSGYGGGGGCVDYVEEEGGSGYGRGVVLMSVRKRVVMVMGEGLN